MDNLSAFAMGEANRGKPSKVFDWVKAAELIRLRKPAEASAGLAGDWEWTGGVIFAAGEPVLDSYTYLSSSWATPELDMDGEVVDCWRWRAETEWDSSTKWPAEALAALRGE